MAVNNKTFSSKQEKLIADALGGYVIGGSGAAPAVPGDVKTYEWLVECKTHTEPDHPIFFDIDVWNKICNEAMATGRKPVLVVDDGSQTEDKTWCLCRPDNINLANVLVGEYPGSIRKNISIKHSKLIDAEKQIRKANGIPSVGIYTGFAFSVNWANEELVIMQLSVFKENFEK